MKNNFVSKFLHKFNKPHVEEDKRNKLMDEAVKNDMKEDYTPPPEYRIIKEEFASGRVGYKVQKDVSWSHIGVYYPVEVFDSLEEAQGYINDNTKIKEEVMYVE